jgi:histidine triad (HIT) family protein
MITEPDCPFCAAAAGAPITPVVYETEAALAFVPLRPAARGHTIVIPRTHVPDVWALEPALAAPLTEAVLRVAHGIREALEPDGLNVLTSAGAAATQTVMHLHIHLVPRWHGDDFGPIWPDSGPDFTDDEIEATAVRIGERLRAS